MLHIPSPSYNGWSYNNYGSNPAATYGGSVTAGGSANTESATPLVLATGANLAQDVYLMELHVYNVSGTGSRPQLMDIGVDPAGGTSYTYIINNIVCGNTGANTTAAHGYYFLFPLFIKSGSQVACRTQNGQASITTSVAANFLGYRSRPEFFPVGSFSETIGTPSNSNGQSFTPGNAADGSWADLGATSKAMWWWQLSYQINNTTVTAEYTYIDLAWGDASNKHIIMRAVHGGTTAETCSDLFTANRSIGCYCPVPAGANLYVRGRCNNSPDSGYNALAIGIGG